MNIQKGFTLIELMIVVVIVGFLSAIAYPAYTDHVFRGRVVEATSVLADSRIKLAQYYQDHISYAGWTCPAATEFFSYACVTADGPPPTYTITATGTGVMNGFTFTVDQANIRSSSSSMWGTSGACWIMHRGGTC